ncbi:hypothetical protein CVT24_007370, partial [Panaeolus cyanescens]
MSQNEQKFKFNLFQGFGLPLDYVRSEYDADYIGPLFPNALDLADVEQEGASLPIPTLRELSMLEFMNIITDKPEWHIKVRDRAMVKKWKEEVSAANNDFTEKMFGYCIQELRHNASLIPEPPALPPPIIVYDANVVKSDFAVSDSIKKELQDAMQQFEDNIPVHLRDWHPYSDEQVLDLVHPSLFPLVYGTTRILIHGTTTLDDCIQRCGEGSISFEYPRLQNAKRATSENAHKESGPTGNTTFQWLPCEVDISGDEARITSYINNLHPREKGLYKLVEKIIHASIGLWDVTLAPLSSRDGGDRYYPKRISSSADWVPKYDPDPENAPETQRPQRLPVLTPEKPEYGGGTWRVEGQLNEHIVATSIYYYSCENITASPLLFRQQVCTMDTNDSDNESDHPQNDHEWLGVLYGRDYGSGVQVIGGVDTREGRLLAFPNILQHRVQPFKLADPTKPGHRKVLALFLVDPNIKVTSTAHVPCQRKDWWQEAIMEEQISSSDDTGLARLPIELQNLVFDDVRGFPLDMDEAKALRLELMKERTANVQDMSQNETTSNLLPGFGLPLNHVPRRRDADYVAPLIPNALDFYDLEKEKASLPLTTLRELSMLHFMNQVTDKPDWHIKVRDRAIVKKWKEE